MKRYMIIQPMNGFSDEEIKELRDKAIIWLNNQGIHVIDSFVEDYPGSDTKNPGIFYLAKSIDIMSRCDGVYCLKGWKKARGCKIEHEIALSYGLNIMYEE